jgi:asparagine synthase (glutamine-hydrolysing)
VCGILGSFNPDGNLQINQSSIQGLLATLRRRGPDASGHYIDENVFLGHTRLSIIDLSSGDQPIYNENRTKCIVFNGEIFNFAEIKSELVNCGHIFSTNSDTEVILHAYEQWNEACIDRFRGMFSFAIYNISDKSLFIVRDRLGIKPLFYARSGNNFYFASEIKAILKMTDIARDIDTNAMASYFTLGYIPASLTIYKHIRKLMPGHYMKISRTGVSVSRYWNLYFCPDENKSESYYIENIRHLLEESVSLRMISDVPIGAFLSGGIDSGVVTALMAGKSNSRIHTFCMGYGGNTGGFLDERRYARLVADRYGADHREFEVMPDIESIAGDIVKAFDEPFADASTVPSYYLCQLTRRHVTVALSGLGGDELFGGYERYLGYKLSSYYNMIPSFIRHSVINRIVNCIPERSDGHYTINHLKRFTRSAALPDFQRYFGFISSGMDKYLSLFSNQKTMRDGRKYCEDLMSGYFNSDNAKNPLDKVFYTDIMFYLPEDILACTDRISMWHSLEARVPFLDHRLLEFCARIPNRLKIHGTQKKYILRKAYSTSLPKEIFTHRKQGFIGPMTRWLQTDMKEFVSSTLSESRLNKHGIFNYDSINKIITEHNSRVEINDKLIWSLLIFQIWYEKYIEGISE